MKKTLKTEEWKIVYTTTKLYDAEMIKEILKDKFEVVLINKKDSSYLFGSIELYVRYENVKEAKLVIQNIKQSE